jgi:branched-chain amino acid transport system substrate-binding protein
MSGASMSSNTHHLFLSLICIGVLTLTSCQSQQKNSTLQVEAKNDALRAAAIEAQKRKPPSQTRPPVEGPRLPPEPPKDVVAVAPVLEPVPQVPSFLPYLQGRAGTEPQGHKPSALVPPPATSDTVRVALMLPLTGRYATIGNAMLNAAQLALFDFADPRFELLPLDTKGTSSGAARAAQNAIGDGATLIIGPLLADSARAVSPYARAANVPVVAFSNDSSIAGQGVYTMGFLPSAQVSRVAYYANRKGITRFAALAPNNTYGVRVVKALEKSVRELGGQLVQTQYYDPFAQDFTEPVRVLADYDNRRRALLEQRKELEEEGGELATKALKRLENLQTIGDLPYEALLVADGGNRLRSVAALLPFYDIDPGKIRMLGTGQWDEPGIGKEPALIGGWYAAPPPSARTDFETQYRDTYASAPPRLVTLAYDATALAAVFAAGDGAPDFSAAAFTNNSGFWGRDGIFRFSPSGIAERGLAVIEIGRDSNKVISNAPESFELVIN